MESSRTKPNLMSILISILFIALGIAGITYYFFVDKLSLKIFLMSMSIVLILIAIAIGLGTISNYEEVEGDKLNIHRFFKTKVVLISDLSCIEFHGSYLRVMDKEGYEVCCIMTSKANLIPFLECLEKNGIEILDFNEK